MDLVAIGHVTFDETPSGVRPGGSAYYVALAARRLGLEVGLLTSGAPDFPSGVIPAGITVATVSSPRTTRYRVGEAGGSRTLTLLSRAEDIEIEHLPEGWKRAPLAVLCPVVGEVDPALVSAFDDASLALLPPGRMRTPGKDGGMGPQPSEGGGGSLRGRGDRGGHRRGGAARPRRTRRAPRRVPGTPGGVSSGPLAR